MNNLPLQPLAHGGHPFQNFCSLDISEEEHAPLIVVCNGQVGDVDANIELPLSKEVLTFTHIPVNTSGRFPTNLSDLFPVFPPPPGEPPPPGNPPPPSSGPAGKPLPGNGSPVVLFLVGGLVDLGQ